MLDLSWMAWTWPTAAFFTFILCALACMAVREWRSPGGGPRRGILGLDTTRGDRRFISLLGTGFILLAWLAAFGAPLSGAAVIATVYGFAVFRWVWGICL